MSDYGRLNISKNASIEAKALAKDLRTYVILLKGRFWVIDIQFFFAEGGVNYAESRKIRLNEATWLNF